MRVLDQGEGFEPEEVADPLAPENILKSSGRGIFFMRSFMDDVVLQRARRGRHGSAHGQEAGGWCLSRSLRSFSPPPSKRSIRAGDVQMAHFGGDIRVDKKGTIDLVTEIDLRVEREFRALIAERFPGSRRPRRGVLERRRPRRARRSCWVFDPVDGTTNYAHGLPIFCSSLALEIDGEPAVGAIYDPDRRELFTARARRRARG